MEKLVINGPSRLQGDVTISGAKNAAVAIIPATLLIDGVCTLENVPNISQEAANLIASSPDGNIAIAASGLDDKGNLKSFDIDGNESSSGGFIITMSVLSSLSEISEILTIS